MDIRNIFINNNIEIEKIGNGIKRKIIANNENLMAVEVYFDKDAIGALHSHFHEQITYVLKGKFEYNINGEKTILEIGDSVYTQPDIEHGVICLEEGILLDIFTPCRKDFYKIYILLKGIKYARVIKNLERHYYGTIKIII